MKIACLKHLWWGVSVGGKHYTGEIVFNGETIELIRKLSRKEAKQLAQDDECPIWETETNRFNSLEQLERFAIKWCEKNLGDEWLLLENDCLNPNRPIAGKGKIEKNISVLEDIAKIWDSIPDSNRTDEVFHAAGLLWKHYLKT